LLNESARDLLSFDALRSCSLAGDSRARSDEFKVVRAENSGMKEGVADVTLKNWVLNFLTGYFERATGAALIEYRLGELGRA
jgi:hypothetical protein